MDLTSGLFDPSSFDDHLHSQDADDLETLGGVGSGIRGHHTDREKKTFDANDDYSSQRAINDYGQLTHDQINSYLRGTGGWTGQALADSKNYVKALDSAFENPHVYKTMTEDKTVYRGIADERVWRSFSRLKVGSVVGDKAFLSTSFKDSIAEKATDYDKSIMLAIRVPKGTRYLSGRNDEREAILNRGLKLKITGIQKGKMIYVDAKVAR